MISVQIYNKIENVAPFTAQDLVEGGGGMGAEFASEGTD